MFPSQSLELEADIRETLREIDEAILLVKHEAVMLGQDPHKVRLADGTYVLHPLLVGKASALNALISLKKG